MHTHAPNQPLSTLAIPTPTATADAAPVSPAAVPPALALAAVTTETKPDTLESLAIDANALARAIWSGRGDDVSRLVADLLKGRDAA